MEMNDARMFYLKTYGRMDTIDQLIGHCNMNYCSWKYWHAATNHGIALEIVVTYDMYLEYAQGSLQQEWKIDRKIIMDFQAFRERLSLQGLQYLPANGCYPGDQGMHVVTKLSLKQRQRMFVQENSDKIQWKRGHPFKISNKKSKEVTPDQFKTAKQHRIQSRLCGGDLGSLVEPLAMFLEPGLHVKYGNKCSWCGEIVWTRCTMCDSHCSSFTLSPLSSKGHSNLSGDPGLACIANIL
jgi:hypothetical protein